MISTRLLPVLASLALALPARGAQLSYHLNGTVTRVVGSAVGALGALGVQHDAPVSIDWTVELTTPVHSTNPAVNSTEYWATTPSNGITSITIKIGSWTATGGDPSAPGTIAVNRVIVGGGTAANPAQTLDISRTATDTQSLVTAGDPNDSEIVLNLFAPAGGTSTDNALGDQDPTRYRESTGFVMGRTGIEVDFSMPGPDPTVKCRASQLASAGTLCQTSFGCLAAHAKAASRDPQNAKLDACVQKAHDRFVAAFDAAATAAARRGASCGTSEDGATFADDFATAESHAVTIVASVQPQNTPVVSSWYAGAGAMCGAAAKAEAKNVIKSSGQVARLRESARLKLGTAASKAVAKAESKGVVFAPEPDVAGLVSAVDALVDDLVGIVDGH